MASKRERAGTESGNHVQNGRVGTWGPRDRTGSLTHGKFAEYPKPCRIVLGRSFGHPNRSDVTLDACHGLLGREEAARWRKALLSFDLGGSEYFQFAAWRVGRGAEAGAPGRGTNDFGRATSDGHANIAEEVELADPGLSMGEYLHRTGRLRRVEEGNFEVCTGARFLTFLFRGRLQGRKTRYQQARDDALTTPAGSPVDNAVEEPAASPIEQFMQKLTEPGRTIVSAASGNDILLTVDELTSLVDLWIRHFWAGTTFRHSELDARGQCGRAPHFGWESYVDVADRFRPVKTGGPKGPGCRVAGSPECE